MAKLSKALGVALTTTLFVALIALLAFQFIAIATGLEVWGLPPLLAYLVAAGGLWAALTLRNWRRGATQPIQLPLVTVVCPKCGTDVEIMQRGLAMRLRSPDKCQHRSDGRLFECEVMQQAIDTRVSE